MAARSPPMPSHACSTCLPLPCAVRKRHWYPGRTSGKIGGPGKGAAQTRRLEVDVRDPRHGQQVDNAGMCASQFLVVLDCQQYVGGPSAIRNEDWPSLCCLLRAAGVLIERAARQGCDRHSGTSPLSINVATYSRSRLHWQL